MRIPGPIRLVLVALALVLGACAQQQPAGNDPATAPPERGTFPVTIEAGNGPVTIESQPQRIVSLSPTATEILFAVGAGDQVVAVDDQSDYPEGVPTTKLSGYEPNVEAIANYEPDLVIASGAPGLKGLKDLKIPLVVHPTATTLADTYKQIEQTGSVTGHVQEAEDQVTEIRAAIDELTAEAPDVDPPPTYYHELDETYFSVTSDTFIGQIYALAGLENIADKADKAGSGYPQLSAEYIVEADPDLIFLADSECCQQTAATVSKRPGWDQIVAVEKGNIVEVGDDVASRWGPRVVDLLRIAVEAAKKLEK